MYQTWISDFRFSPPSDFPYLISHFHLRHIYFQLLAPFSSTFCYFWSQSGHLFQTESPLKLLNPPHLFSQMSKSEVFVNRAGVGRATATPTGGVLFRFPVPSVLCIGKTGIPRLRFGWAQAAGRLLYHGCALWCWCSRQGVEEGDFLVEFLHSSLEANQRSTVRLREQPPPSFEPCSLDKR